MSIKGRGTKAVAAAALVLALSMMVAVGLAGPAGASDGSRSGRSTAGPAAAEYALKLGPRHRAALRRKLRRMRRVTSLEPRALKRFPGAFGGIWRTEGGKLKLAFTTKPDAKAGKLRRSFAPAKRLAASRIDGVKVDDTLAYLRDLVSDLSYDRGRVFEGGYDVNLDLTGNRVLVVFTDEFSPSQFAFASQEIRDRYGARAEDISFSQAPLAGEEATCKSIHECRDLRAGLRVVKPFAGGCTTAFVVTRPAGMSTSSEAILSAGHCGGGTDVGGERAHGNNLTVYGEVFDDVYEGAVDAEVHEITHSGFGTALTVYRNSDTVIGGDKNLPVVAVSKYNNLLVGTLVCRTGITTGVHCGKVTGKDFAPSIVPDSSGFITANVCGESGDSGGPWYQPFSYKPAFGPKVHVAMATGVHGGGVYKGKGCDDAGGDPSYFSHITHVKKALGVKVRTPVGGL